MIFKVEVLTFLVAAAPVFELRGAIPLGLTQGLSLSKVLFLAIIGNLFVIMPLLYGLRLIAHRLEDISGIGKLLHWWFQRVGEKSYTVKKYGFWGLVFLVAIPLPGTGAWTGAACATLLNFEVKRAFYAISLGVLIAGVIVTLLSLGILTGLDIIS